MFLVNNTYSKNLTRINLLKGEGAKQNSKGAIAPLDPLPFYTYKLVKA